MSATLTTHVLDTTRGKPAAGMQLQLFRSESATLRSFVVTTTNADGRCDKPLLAGDLMQTGDYQLWFYVGDYFEAQDHPDANLFLKIVPICFTISDPGSSHHVPLLVSPWAYSTYRGG